MWNIIESNLAIVYKTSDISPISIKITLPNFTRYLYIAFKFSTEIWNIWMKQIKQPRVCGSSAVCLPTCALDSWRQDKQVVHFYFKSRHEKGTVVQILFFIYLCVQWVVHKKVPGRHCYIAKIFFAITFHNDFYCAFCRILWKCTKFCSVEERRKASKLADGLVGQSTACRRAV